jgi:hypothetical protein
VLTVQTVLRPVKSRLVALLAAVVVLLLASASLATHVASEASLTPTPKVWDVSRIQGHVMETMQTWCAENLEGDWKTTCSYEFWETFAPLYGAVQSFNAVLKERELRPDFLPECHHAMHAVGQTAFKQIGMHATLQLGNDLCQGGYVHGALQEWTLSGTGSDGVATVCDAAKHGANVYSMCAHGLGHAVALRFPTSLTGALKVCSEVVPSEIIGGCATGVIMEFSGSDHVTVGIQTSIAAPPKENVTALDRRTGCNAIPQAAPREECWRWQHMLFPRDQVSDPTKYAALCKGATVEADNRACMLTWVEQATWTINVFSPRDPGVEKKIEPVFEGCGKLSLDASLVESCRARLIDNIWRDEPLTSSAPNFCPLVKKEWQMACEKGFEQGKLSRQSA